MSNKKVNDPFSDREASKYDNPVPSREFILEHIAKLGQPVTHPSLCHDFNLTKDDEIEALRRRLIAMSRDHQLQSNFDNEYTLIESSDLIEGRVQGTKDGHGFLIREDADDIFLSPRQMQSVMDGDIVVGRLSGRTVKGRLDGVVVEVKERKHTQIVGRYYEESATAFVTPENPRITQDVLIDQFSGLTPKHGQYVLVEFLEYGDRNSAAKGLIKKVLGDFMAPGMEIDVAIHRYDIPNVWPKSVENQVKHFGTEVVEEDKANRVDHRETPFVTIDGEDARDFDDAVYCEKTPGGWKLFVAIADVSHYVKKGSALDKEAIVRGNSVYFPGRVVPMLPEVLSNGLCSLNPDVDRLAMVAEISLTSRGKMRGFKFYEGLIRSHARLTYSKVAKMIDAEPDEQGTELRQRYAPIVSHIDDLHGLYKVLREAREQRGAMDFDTVETRMVFDEHSKIDQIVPIERNDAHKLIEECMLCANVAAAELLLKADLAALFRVHEGPKEEKLLALRTYLSILGLELEGGLKPTPMDYAKLGEAIRERADSRSIQTMMLRSMSQAVYQADNLGHFGLHYEAYTHFTSPIRRYPDLLVHRAIRYLIRGDGAPKVRQVYKVPGSDKLKANKIYGYDHADMDGLGDSCSTTERRADEATRDVEAWLKCQYVEQHLGEEFDGIITAVTPFGVFVELGGLFVEGLIHISGLGNDYFIHDPEHQAIIGERTGKSFKLGTKVKVSVSSVNLDQRKIDLSLVQNRPEKPKKRVEKTELSELEMQLAQLPPMELGGRKPSSEGASKSNNRGEKESWSTSKRDAEKQADAKKGRKKSPRKKVSLNKGKPKTKEQKAEKARNSSEAKKSNSVKKRAVKGATDKKVVPDVKKKKARKSKKSNAKRRAID
ncbi:ribonuclease R [Marinomonas mediterranea]|uniref:Ribonuclease R n=1 Tax=Marinomonas mediterranea (strain ATCC 700492 / JCM 21426 / NBRC 103028 / MMB-1) TaxID=717774 RepID=F2K2Z4_MARM1|nr:ribonuclease R [Marinomonas mediterranea]ADZ92383.1 ribonuclease R [Marinomonas mediterranea MMB-1]WCN18432.1 ribonuclease R [Marinomonas mediterranea MMB-1]